MIRWVGRLFRYRGGRADYLAALAADGRRWPGVWEYNHARWSAVVWTDRGRL